MQRLILTLVVTAGLATTPIVLRSIARRRLDAERARAEAQRIRDLEVIRARARAALED